jgi:hypothetical protein
MRAVRDEVRGIMTKAEAMTEHQLENLENLLKMMHDSVMFKKKSMLTNAADVGERRRYLETSNSIRDDVLDKVI